MMGDRKVQQDALFYEFSLERHVPDTDLLRAIDRFVELDGVRAYLAPFYSETGRPSIDPELLIRMSESYRPSNLYGRKRGAA
jgi:transposase